MAAANDWKDMLAEIMGDTDNYDMFNVNEVGLFYKCASDKTMAFKKETCVGRKHNKERIMVLVSANMDGSEKLPLLVIGKSKIPWCFKNVKSKLVQYEANKKA